MLKTVDSGNAWSACIKVWTTLIKWAKLNNGRVPDKSIAVEQAGYVECHHDCPMCEVYGSSENPKGYCVGCPIAHHFGMEYACEFASEYGVFREHGMKRIEDAERFLAELKRIRRLDELGLIDYSRPLNPAPPSEWEREKVIFD